MTRRAASLGMYDQAAQVGANDLLWAAVARSLRDQGIADVPEGLDRTRDVHMIWRDPKLLLGQACGYPLVADPTLALRIVAVPAYAVPGCKGATHRSVIVARADDGRGTLEGYRGTRATINDARSNTGMNLFRATIADIARERFFGAVAETGSHRASIIAVGSGVADIAAIDAVTFAAIERFEPALTAPLRIVASSPSSPTLPFVTAAATDDATLSALRTALDSAIADPALAQARDALFLETVEPAGPAVLDPIAALEASAIRAGYAELR